MDVEELRTLSIILKSRLQKSSATINKVTSALDREMNIEAGTSLMLFKHLLAIKEIVMDLVSTKISGCLDVQAIKQIIFN